MSTSGLHTPRHTHTPHTHVYKCTHTCIHAETSTYTCPCIYMHTQVYKKDIGSQMWCCMLQSQLSGGRSRRILRLRPALSCTGRSCLGECLLSVAVINHWPRVTRTGLLPLPGSIPHQGMQAEEQGWNPEAGTKAGVRGGPLIGLLYAVLSPLLLQPRTTFPGWHCPQCSGPSHVNH